MPEQSARLLPQLLSFLLACALSSPLLISLVEYSPHLWNTSDNIWRQTLEDIKETLGISYQANSSSDQQAGPEVVQVASCTQQPTSYVHIAAV